MNIHGPWAPRIKEEVENVRDNCGVLDLPGFSRFTLSGKGSSQYLLGLITGGLPKIGRMNLAYFADTRGRILTEMSVIRHEHDRFTLITAASAQWHDFDILNNGLPERARNHDRAGHAGGHWPHLARSAVWDH